MYSLESAEMCLFLLWCCQITGSGSQMECAWSEFHFFWGLEMLGFHGFHQFLGGFFALESWTEMMVPGFMPFSYWKSVKFTGNLKIHVLSTMQYGQFCSAPQAHCVCLNKFELGFNGMLSEEVHF